MLDDVCAVVVTHNDEAHVDDCLATLHPSRQQGAKVVVVDSGSTDATVLRASAVDYADVHPVGKNVGFAAAANRGARVAFSRGAECVVILNADTRLPVDSLPQLAKFLHDSPETGVVGPLQVPLEGLRSSDLLTLNAWTSKALTSCATSYICRYRRNEVHDATPWTNDGAIAVCYVQGGAMAISRRAFESTGGFDELFENFHEDVDLCRRAVWSGYRVVLLPTAIVEHQGRDMSVHSTHRRYCRVRGRLLFLLTEPSAHSLDVARFVFKQAVNDVRDVVRSPGPVRRDCAVALLAAWGWLIVNASAVHQARVARRRWWQRGPRHETAQ